MRERVFEIDLRFLGVKWRGGDFWTDGNFVVKL